MRPQITPPKQPVNIDIHHGQPFKILTPLNAAPIRNDPSEVISGNPIILNDVIVPNDNVEYSNPIIKDAQHNSIIMSFKDFCLF